MTVVLKVCLSRIIRRELSSIFLGSGDETGNEMRMILEDEKRIRVVMTEWVHPYLYKPVKLAEVMKEV